MLVKMAFIPAIGRKIEQKNLTKKKTHNNMVFCTKMSVLSIIIFHHEVPAVPEKGSDQLIVTLYTLSLYPSVHNQLIRPLYESQSVSYVYIILPNF